MEERKKLSMNRGGKTTDQELYIRISSQVFEQSLVKNGVLKKDGKNIALLYLMDNAQQSLPFTGPPARGGPTAGSSAGRYRFDQIYTYCYKDSL